MGKVNEDREKGKLLIIFIRFAKLNIDFHKKTK